MLQYNKGSDKVNKNTKYICLSGMFLALALVLPFVTG